MADAQLRPRQKAAESAKFPELFEHRDRRSLDWPPNSLAKGMQFLIKACDRTVTTE